MQIMFWGLGQHHWRKKSTFYFDGEDVEYIAGTESDLYVMNHEKAIVKT